MASGLSLKSCPTCLKMFFVVCGVWLINVEHNLSIIIWCEGPIWGNLYCWSQFTKIIVACKFYHTFTIVFPLDLGLIQRKVNDAILKVSAINYKKKSYLSRVWGLPRSYPSFVFWGVRYRVWVNPESAWSQVMTVVSSPRLMLSLSHPQFRHYQGWYHHPHYAPIKPRVTTTIIF